MAALSSTATISSLGELAGSTECHVSCGGTIPEVKSVDIIYKKESGVWSSKPLQLPADVVGDKLQDFLDSCSTASFGVGGEDVTGCDVLQLEPKCFYVGFEIANTFVLGYINEVMSPDSPVRAELYKLNVYSPGGHFKLKSVVDTPRSKDKFGSLVVCLPSEFTGGALLTRHQGREVKFDWSSSTSTHWAAFFSDVEYEVLPIASGHQITLTYNLYNLSTGSNFPNLLAGLHPGSVDVRSNPLYQELLVALQNPHFMSGGGTLGFCCQHEYSDPSTDLEAFAPFLKGGDAIVYGIAKALDLSISLKPLLCDRQKKPVFNLQGDEDCNYVLPNFVPHKNKEYLDDDKDEEKLVNAFDDLVKVKGITWIRPPGILTPLFSFVTVTGEERFPMYMSILMGRSTYKTFGADAYYQSATFLIEVPIFTSRHCESVEPPAKKAKRQTAEREATKEATKNAV